MNRKNYNDQYKTIESLRKIKNERLYCNDPYVKENLSSFLKRDADEFIELRKEKCLFRLRFL